MLGALSAIGSIFSAVSAALKALFLRKVYEAGAVAQQATDLKAVVKEDADGAKIEAAVDRLSDAELDDRLAARMRGSSPGSN